MFIPKSYPLDAITGHANMTPAAIRTARKRLKMSYRDFAHALGFTGKQSHISVWRWEAGKRVPSEQTIRLIKMLLEAK